MLRLVFSLSICLLLPACDRPAPEFDSTINLNDKWIAQHLGEFLNEVSLRKDAKIHFSAKALFTSKLATPENPREFDLAIGDSFFEPDHHGSTSFTVKEIRPSSVVLSYQVTFDHRSFGKNLISRDDGLVEIPIK
jgi:hypothetical protein